MAQTKNTFTKLNQDLAKNKISQELYFDALNVRLITDEGSSSGAIENTKGTKIAFKLPDLTSATYEFQSQYGSITVPALTNLTIIGWCNVNNKIVLFTKSYADIKTVYNQIWMFEFNETTDEIVGLNNGYLVQSTHLRYNRKLGITNKVKCFGIQESTKFLRVYWTDTVNSLMSINLSNPNSLNIPQRTLPINSNVDMTIPTVEELGLGNLPNGCIQYFYRLIHKDGAITNFSPLSNLFQLNNGNEEGEWKDYPAIVLDRYNDKSEAENQERLDATSENGCMIKFDNVDKDYDYIQIGYVHWKFKDSPTFYLLDMEPLQVDNTTKDKSFTYYHDGSETKSSITQEEFNKLVTVWDNCYTLETKDNILYVANTKGSQFDIDRLADELRQQRWDARAYRFDNNKICRIYKANGDLEAQFSYPQFPDPTTEYSYDAINPDTSEHEDNPINYDNSYKYNPSFSSSAGYRYGGVGPNVNYIFTNNSMVVDTDVPITTPSFYATIENVGNYTNGIFMSNKETVPLGLPLTKLPRATASNIPIPVGAIGSTTDRQDKSWSDFKNPYLASKIATHQHGETYRYWITFYNKKNQPSFAKWIADIKTPEFNDSDIAATYKLSDFYGNTMTVDTMGIEFKISIPTWLAQNISGFSIGRTERQEEDKTRLGTGITGRFYKQETEQLTFEGFKNALMGLAFEFLINSTNNASGLLGLGAGISEVVNDFIDKTFKNFRKSVERKLTENLTEENLRQIIKGIFDHATSIGGGGLTSLPTFKIFGPLIEPLVENLVINMLEIVKYKIGWIDEKMYSLGTSWGDYNYHDKAIYSIFPAQQFDRYNYKTGDYITIVQKFNLLYDYTNNFFLQDKLVDCIHEYTNTGLLNRTNSSSILRKWYRGNILRPSTGGLKVKYAIDKELSFDEGEILKSNFVDNTTGTFTNSYVGYMERYDYVNRYLGEGAIPDTVTGEARKLALNAIKPLSQKKKVLGLGDRKHILVLDSAFIAPNFDAVMIDGQNSLGKSNQDNSFNVNKALICTTLGQLALNGTEEFYRSSAVFTAHSDPEDDSNRLYYEGNNISKPRLIDTDGDCIISYNRVVNKQYGGSSIAERNNNTVIELSFVKTTDTANVYTTNPIGDSYVGLYAAVNYNYYFEQFGPYEPANRTKKAMIEIFPTEQSFNFNLREGRHVFNSLSTADLDTTEQKTKRLVRRAKRKARRFGIDEQSLTNLVLPKRFIFDEFKFDDVYTQEKNAKILVPKPIINTFVDTNTNRIWKSKPKQNGELIDSFREFKALDYLDVEANRGPIRDLVNFKGQLIFLQDNGIGIATTNEKASAATSTGTFALISSTPLSRYDYLSKESGTNQRFSTVITDSFFSYFDTNKKKLIKFGEGLEPLSDVEGLSGYFRTRINSEYFTQDDIIVGGYFPEYNTLFYTFNNIESPFTISYNLLQQGFESFHSIQPELYLKLNNRLLIANEGQGYQVFKGERGFFYDIYQPSYITVVTNENPNKFKIFDNISFFSEVYDSNNVNLTNQSINKIQCSNDYQDTGEVSLTVSNYSLYTDPTNKIKRFDREWKLDVPRDINTPAYTSIQARMKDYYLKTKLIFNNNNNKKFILQDILTTYRIN